MNYEEIYDYQDCGFSFDYNKGHVGKSKLISREEINNLGISKHNFDDSPMFVKCKKCNEYMDYMGENDGDISGKWICPICGVKVRETTIYNTLDKENQSWLADNIAEDDYDEYWE